MAVVSALVTVAGIALPEPSTYSGTTATIVDAARNTEGVTIGSVIRDDIAKVEMTWRYLTIKQWADINKLFKISAGGKFINDVRFFDQTTGSYTTRKMYVSDRTAEIFKRDRHTGVVMGWLEPRIALVEV